MKTLVLGWFSFDFGNATAGDLLAKDVVGEWLHAAGHSFDVAVEDPPFTGGVDWRTVPPGDYTHLLFVCGPFGECPEITELFERFAHCRKIGINLSMLQDLDHYNPFDLLIERDSSATANPDISLLGDQEKVPVVGLCLVEPQEEYGKRARHQEANEAIQRLIDSREMAVVPIDTRLDHNATGLRTPAEVESLLARVDVVLTTRLHGTALALKNGVPAIAVDAIEGGAKVTRQADVLGWPVRFNVESVTDEQLQEAFDYCLTAEARIKARECADGARRALANLRQRFLDEIDSDSP